jgi:hypothetical protein
MTESIAEVPGLHRVRRFVKASSDAVWDVLADGWSYSSWVVGTARVRAVEDSWPAVGSKIHHSFGTWPILLDDHTNVVSESPGEWLELQARGWPAGEARVRLDLRGMSSGCEVTIVEDAVSGPGALVPKAVRQPLIVVRNRESLRRLALIAEGRTDAEDHGLSPT